MRRRRSTVRGPGAPRWRTPGCPPAGRSGAGRSGSASAGRTRRRRFGPSASCARRPSARRSGWSRLRAHPPAGSGPGAPARAPTPQSGPSRHPARRAARACPDRPPPRFGRSSGGGPRTSRATAPRIARRRCPRTRRAGSGAGFRDRPARGGRVGDIEVHLRVRTVEHESQLRAGQREQTEGPQRDRLAARVRAGHQERLEVRAELHVDGNDPPGQPGMAGSLEDDLGAGPDLGTGCVHLLGEARLRAPQVETGQRTEQLEERP